MAKTANPLTYKQLLSAKIKKSQYNLSDGKGLQFRVSPNSSKLWVFNYMHPVLGKRRNLSIGSFPDVSLSDAREKAAEYRAVLALGKDPKQYRDEQNMQRKLEAECNLEMVADEWLAVQASKGRAKKYIAEIRGTLNNFVFPVLGKYPVNELTASIAIQALKPVESMGKLETLKRICQRLNAIMFFAMSKDYIQTNPLEKIGLSFKSPIKKNLPSLNPDELPQFMKALSMANVKLVTRCVIEWQLHTMVRPSEASKAEWSEIDFDKRLWTIPADKMKMKGRADHVVPLTDETIALLALIKPISGNSRYIFPSDKRPNTHINAQTANMAIKRMGYQSKLVAHGLRSIASTTLHANMFEPHVIEACLAHIDPNATSAAYNRTDYLERRRVVMQWWSNYVLEASTGNTSLSANVAHLKIVN